MTQKLIFEAADIAAPAQAWQAHQFHENAPRCRKPLGEQAGLKRMGLHLVRVAPDDATPQFHFHDHADAFVCLSFGELTLEYGAEIYTLNP